MGLKIFYHKSIKKIAKIIRITDKLCNFVLDYHGNF